MTQIWGSDYWKLLHLITINYPINPSDKDKKNFENIIKYLPYVLPCPICSSNFIKHVKYIPLKKSQSSRNDLVTWMIDLHNLVNISLDKKCITQKEAQNYIDNMLNLDFINQFKIVLDHIKNLIVINNISDDICNNISKFIKYVFYFSNTEYTIDFVFHDYDTFNKIFDYL